MRYQSLTVLAAATAVQALTPPGFLPASQTQLFVQYGNQAALNGINLPQQCKSPSRITIIPWREGDPELTNTPKSQ
jgi:hypothetical protein